MQSEAARKGATSVMRGENLQEVPESNGVDAITDAEFRQPRMLSITNHQWLNRQSAYGPPTSRRYREKWGARIASPGGALLERLHRCRFVVFHVEYRVELSDL